LPRKTDSSNPADWLYLCTADLAGLRALASQHLSYHLCRSKLAEVIEKALKAELIRAGWKLRRTHDLIELEAELAHFSPGLLPQVQPLTEAFAQVYFSDRYPGFDLEDEDWPTLLIHCEAVGDLLTTIERRLEA
jgi:HEPN domain-containing protein